MVDESGAEKKEYTPKHGVHAVKRYVEGNLQGLENRKYSREEVQRIAAQQGMDVYSKFLAEPRVESEDIFQDIAEMVSIELDPRIQRKKATKMSSLDGEIELLLGEGDLEGALKKYNKAVKLDRNSAYLWHNRGSVLSDLERHEEALESYDKALKIDPNDPLTWQNAGNILHIMGKYGESLDYFKKGLEQKPKGKALLICTAIAYRRTDNPHKAIEMYDRVLEIDEDSVGAWLGKAQAHKALGEEIEYEFCIQRARELGSNV